MTWPENPTKPQDLPLEVSNQLLLDTLEIPTPGTGAQLCEFVAHFHDELDDITKGDPEKEKKLGQILLNLAYRSANYAISTGLRDLRYGIARLEMGGY